MSDSDRGNRLTTVEAAFCGIAILAVALLIYALGQNFGVSAGRNEVSAREHYEDAKREELDACTGREGPAMMQCVTKAVEAAQEQSDSRQDLYAQRDMANFAFWLLMLTGGTFGVTALGVWYVKRTLDTNVGFLAESSKATKAMERQNHIAETAQRPWLVFDIEQIGPVERHALPAYSSGFKIKIKNTGSMPATKAIAYIGYVDGPQLSMTPERFLKEAQILIDVVGFSIAPNDSMPWNGGEFLHGITFHDSSPVPKGHFWIGVAYRGMDGLKDYCTYDLFSFLGTEVWSATEPGVFFPNHQRLKRVMT